MRADVGDVNRQFKNIENSLGGVDRSAKGGQLSLGRLGNQFAGLAGRIAGVHPIVGNLASVLGNFAIGAGLTVGVLAGVAAIALVYEKLTGEARKAKKENDALIESFEKAQRLKSAGGVSGQTSTAVQARVDAARAALANPFSRGSTASLQKELDDALKLQRAAASEHDEILTTSAQSTVKTYAGNLANLISSNQASEKERKNALTLIKTWQEDLKRLPSTDTAGRAELNSQISTLQGAFDSTTKKAKDAADKIAAAVKKVQQDFQAGAQATLTVFDNLASHGTESSVVNQKLIADYSKIAEQIRQMGSASGPAVVELLRLRDALAANLVVAQEIARLNSTGTVGPLSGKTLPSVGVTPNTAIQDAIDKQRGVTSKVGSPSDPLFKVGDELQIQLQKDADRALQNAQMLQSAIAQSASIIGSTIVSALNVGGGGRGSNLGGALGGTAGSIAGMIIGAPGGPLGMAIGSAIGSTVGSIAGSLFGGLFDSNKKAVNANTQAIRALTAEIHNAPSGFKINQARYDATDVTDRLGRALRQRASRGGANPLLVGT